MAFVVEYHVNLAIHIDVDEVEQGDLWLLLFCTFFLFARLFFAIIWACLLTVAIFTFLGLRTAFLFICVTLVILVHYNWEVIPNQFLLRLHEAVFALLINQLLDVQFVVHFTSGLIYPRQENVWHAIAVQIDESVGMRTRDFIPAIKIEAVCILRT